MQLRRIFHHLIPQSEHLTIFTDTTHTYPLTTRWLCSTQTGAIRARTLARVFAKHSTSNALTVSGTDTETSKGTDNNTGKGADTGTGADDADTEPKPALDGDSKEV